MNLEALVVMWVVRPMQIQTAFLFNLVKVIDRSLTRLVQVASLIRRSTSSIVVAVLLLLLVVVAVVVVVLHTAFDLRQLL